MKALFGNKTTLSRKKALEGRIFVFPWVIGFLLFVAWPLTYSLFLGFNKVNVAGFKTNFIGLKNFARAFFIDIDFLPLLWETLADVIINTPVLTVFSLAVAILLNRRMKGRGLLRGLFFLPVVMSSGYVLRELLGQGISGLSVVLGIDEASSGVMNLPSGAVVRGGAETPGSLDIAVLLNEFLGPQLASVIGAFLNRLGITLWRSGIQILLFLAGLQGISSSLYEAARIDGADEWKVFWKVTLPIISPILLVVVIFTIVDSFTDIFNPILNYIKDVGFVQNNYGYSAALSWIYFAIIFILLMIVMGLFRKRVFYRGER
jgi:ABC-type sugar transport system permease subunit